MPPGCARPAGSPSAPESSAETESYTVSIAPVGDVSFESVPETWVANDGSWADIGVALDLAPPEAVWLTSRYHTQYYDEILGVSADASDMVSLDQDGVSKELFYELDADVYVIAEKRCVSAGCAGRDLNQRKTVALTPFARCDLLGSNPSGRFSSLRSENAPAGI